jgi:hypothetical protein
MPLHRQILPHQCNIPKTTKIHISCRGQGSLDIFSRYWLAFTHLSNSCMHRFFWYTHACTCIYTHMRLSRTRCKQYIAEYSCACIRWKTCVSVGFLLFPGTRLHGQILKTCGCLSCSARVCGIGQILQHGLGALLDRAVSLLLYMHVYTCVSKSCRVCMYVNHDCMYVRMHMYVSIHAGKSCHTFAHTFPHTYAHTHTHSRIQEVSTAR